MTALRPALLVALLLAGPAAGQVAAPPAPTAIPPSAPAATPSPATAETGPRSAEGTPEVIPPGSPLAASIQLELRPPQDEAEVRSLLELRPGRPVTPFALRRSAVRLFRSGRCRDVVVRQREAAPRPEPGPWVDLTVTCLGHRQVAVLEVEAAGAVPGGEPAIRTAAALDAGAGADEADLEAATARVEALLKRRGHREPRVEVTATDERAAAVTVRVEAGPVTRLAAVALPGAGPLEPALRRAMASRVGGPLDQEVLGADLAALKRELRRAGHWRARVASPAERPVAGGVAVEIAVDPGPQVELRFLGAQAFTAAELRTQLDLNTDQPFDRWAVEAAQDRLRAFYRAHGYAAATVAAEERQAGAALEVRYRIAEGRRYTLRPMTWQGAKGRRAEQLDALLVTLLEDETAPLQPLPGAERARLVEASIPGVPLPPQPPPPLPTGRYLDEVTLSRALDGLRDDYRADGWLDAAVDGWSADLDDRAGEARVAVRLSEGARYRIEAIEFTGQQAAPIAELTRSAHDARLVPGEPLVAERVAATRAALVNRYRAMGHIYARVEARQQVDRDAAQARLRFEIEEGPRVTLGRILVSGNTTTREPVIRGALAVREGAPYDPAALERSQLALLRLGVFRTVSLRLQDADQAEAVKDLLVEVAERPWQTLTASGGFSLADGPRLGLEWARPNLLGRALELSARGKINYPLAVFRPDLEGLSPKGTYEGRGDLGLRVPRLELLGLQAVARTGLGAEKQHRPSYNLTRSAITWALELPASTRLGLTLQDQIEVDVLDYGGNKTAGELTPADLAAKRYLDGTTTLNSLSATATYDRRDNAANPRRGWLAQASAEHFVSMGGAEHDLWLIPGSRWPANAVKLQAGLSGYLSLGPLTVLAAQARAGRIAAVTGSSVTIAPKRFYLGGAGTLRGFSEEAMVPQDLRTALAELRAKCADPANAADEQCLAGTDGRRLASGDQVASAGGQAFLLGKVEVRQVLPFGLELGLFLDVGNLWYNPRAVRLYELRPSAGVGIRAITPVGPLVFDFGFNLRPDKNLNEPTFAPHFTIGLF